VIPISIIATFNLLFFRDITLNIMSLGGLALGVGMFVDNSIIVSESIFRHKGQDKDSFRAAVAGTKEVGMAVTASTLTTISVFLPVVYVHGVAGQLFKDQAYTVTFALLSSLVVSLTLLPMMSSRKLELRKRFEQKKGTESLIKPDKMKEKSRWRWITYPFRKARWLFVHIFKGISWFLSFVISFISQLLVLAFHYLSVPVRPVARFVFKVYNAIYERFSRRYHQFLEWSLNNKGKVIICSIIFLALTLLVATQIPRELMPKPKTFSFEVHLKTPIEFSLEQTKDVTAVIERNLTQNKDVESVFSQIGVVSGMEESNPDISINSAQIHVRVSHPSKVDSVIMNLRKVLQSYPDLSVSIVKEQSTLAQFLAFSTAEVGLKIRGDNLTKLKELAQDLVKKIEGIRGVEDVNANIAEGKPEFVIRLKKEAVEKYNVSPSEISRFLVDAVRGKEASKFREMEKKYGILVRFEEQSRENVDALLDEKISHGGTLIPMRELVTYDIGRGPREIRRDNQQREVVVTANLSGAKISQVVPQIQEKIQEMSLPSGYRIVFSGEQEEMSKSFRSLIFALVLAVLLVYMIMAAQFESLVHPFLILFTLPMGLTGAVWALFITGKTINIISIIGMVVLAGIVVNDAIVKIDYTNQLRRRGFALRKAILEASRVRLRPILMTTVTTAFGLFPMSLGIGRGSELQQPLAISVIGGLLLATFLTLILIPLAYELVEKRKKKNLQMCEEHRGDNG
jgi:HAE1 family hydrophobic/amphiphilic exporter-1